VSVELAVLSMSVAPGTLLADVQLDVGGGAAASVLTTINSYSPQFYPNPGRLLPSPTPANIASFATVCADRASHINTDNPAMAQNFSQLTLL